MLDDDDRQWTDDGYVAEQMNEQTEQEPSKFDLGQIFSEQMNGGPTHHINENVFPLIYGLLLLSCMYGQKQ